MKVSLFITCLVDQFFPETGVSMVDVLRRLGVEIDFPKEQTCCGQPAYNSGFHAEARSLAERFISIFENSEFVVAPSGSCASMVRVFYLQLFKDDAENLKRAESLAAKTYEFGEFLVKVLGVDDVGASWKGKIALHKSCHLLRELGANDETERLLDSGRGLELVELERADVCCGFGGMFSMKYPQISGGILREKIDCIAKSGADVVVACDAGCLMLISGWLIRHVFQNKAMHISDLLGKNY